MAERIRVGIVDDTDCPEAAMLMIAGGEPGRAWIEYLSAAPRLRRYRRSRGVTLSRWTDAAAFGVVLALSEDAVLGVHQVAASIARYPDGVLRLWQGGPHGEIQVRPSCVPALARFILTPTKDRPVRLVIGREGEEFAHG